MAGTTGTHDVSSLLAARLSAVPDFAARNLDRIIELINADITAHNNIMLDALGDLAEITTARDGVYGSTQGGSMKEVDEYGRTATQKAAPGETFGLPLRKFQYATGWTATWFRNHVPADMAIAIGAAQVADRKRVAYELKKALLVSGNYSFTDHLVDNVVVGGTNGVKRLLNADSATIPSGPNGEQFTGSSHTHYVGEATYTQAFLLVEIANVTEHGHSQEIVVYINKAQEAATRAFADFVAYTDARIINQTAGLVAAQRLDMRAPTDNRAIGLVGGAEVWVKPWMPASYVLVFDRQGPKPLRMRQREAALQQGLNMVGSNVAYPLHADYFEREFGFGVYTRTNGSVLFITNATYADYAAAAP
jgi:hypothetical protein